jgi:hypothetical protein
MIQSNLSNKSDDELKLESLKRDRINLYNELTKDLMKSYRDSSKQKLVDEYRREVNEIDKHIKYISDKIRLQNMN